VVIVVEVVEAMDEVAVAADGHAIAAHAALVQGEAVGSEVLV